jgi:uncharacterized membrane protein
MGKLGVSEIILFLFALALHFLPTFIAVTRRTKNRVAIFVLNLLTGWTGLGWIGSLIWACVDKREVQFNFYYQTPSSPKENDSFETKISNVQKLKELYDSGAITQEEFEAQKTKIL